MPDRNLELSDHLRTKLKTRFILYKIIEDGEGNRVMVGPRRYIRRVLHAVVSSEKIIN